MDLYLYADHPVLNACLCIQAVNIASDTFWIALEIKQIALGHVILKILNGPLCSWKIFVVTGTEW